MTDQIPADEHAVQRDEFIERLLQSVNGLYEVFGIYCGDRLGLYQALSANGALNSVELAEITGTNERYIREWMEQQAVVGILELAKNGSSPQERKFYLPGAKAEVLVEADSLNYLAPLAQIVVGSVRPVGQLLEAFRNGSGLPYSDYGSDVINGQAGMNRAMFLQQLGQEYLPSIPDVHARLLADPPARVADIGVGAGWSSIGLAQAYPKIRIDGFDLDEESIDLANRNLEGTGLEDRVAFHLRDAADLEFRGQYDLVAAFETIHDMSDPVGALRSMRGMAAANSAVIVMDERVGESFSPDAGEVEALMYGFSVFLCLPAGMADQPSTATGTVMRPSTFRRYALDAGFRDVEILPIDSYFFRFYRLTS